MLTLVDVCEKLKSVDEITLLEKLEITSEDLVSRFIDVIEDKYDVLCLELEEEGTDD